MPSAEPKIAWSLFRAAQEFGCHRDTLKKRLIASGVNPADGDTYTTAQICAALYGDKHAAQTRLANESADKVALDNAERRRELIPVAEALELTQRFCSEIRQRFMATSLPESDKDALLKDIARLESVDFAAAPVQSGEQETS